MADWIECGLPWTNTPELSSFCMMELNKPGTLIEVEQNGKLFQFLIGDIDVWGSSRCGEWAEIELDAIVKRYKIVMCANVFSPQYRSNSISLPPA